MKQVEKLDLILKGLYQYRFDGKSYAIEGILAESGIEINQQEALSLGRRLSNEGYIKFLPTQQAAYASLTSEGVEYSENDSFTFEGKALITNTYNIAITNSPGANIVYQSQNVTIANQIETVTSIINDIVEKINSDNSISESKKMEIQACVKEVNNNLKAGHIPKFGITSLISLLGDISSVGSLALTLAQVL